MNIGAVRKCRILLRLTTFLVATALVCQNIAWTYPCVEMKKQLDAQKFIKESGFKDEKLELEMICKTIIIWAEKINKQYKKIIENTEDLYTALMDDDFHGSEEIRNMIRKANMEILDYTDKFEIKGKKYTLVFMDTDMPRLRKLNKIEGTDIIAGIYNNTLKFKSLPAPDMEIENPSDLFRRYESSFGEIKKKSADKKKFEQLYKSFKSKIGEGKKNMPYKLQRLINNLRTFFEFTEEIEALEIQLYHYLIERVKLKKIDVNKAKDLLAEIAESVVLATHSIAQPGDEIYIREKKRKEEVCDYKGKAVKITEGGLSLLEGATEEGVILIEGAVVMKKYEYYTQEEFGCKNVLDMLINVGGKPVKVIDLMFNLGMLDEDGVKNMREGTGEGLRFSLESGFTLYKDRGDIKSVFKKRKTIDFFKKIGRIKKSACVIKSEDKAKAMLWLVSGHSHTPESDNSFGFSGGDENGQKESVERIHIKHGRKQGTVKIGSPPCHYIVITKNLLTGKYVIASRTRRDVRNSVSRSKEAENGPMKDIGPALSEEILRELKEKEQRWAEKVKEEKIRAKIYKIKINARRGKKEIIKIPAKIMRADNLPEGVNAWFFRMPTSPMRYLSGAWAKVRDSTLCIVTRSPPEEIPYLNELIYHEDREDYWLGNGKTRREAHILASAEQALAFAYEGKLTKYHQLQIDNMTVPQLRNIIDEYESGARKGLHHKIIKDNIKELEQKFGPKILKDIEDYEAMIRRKALLSLFIKHENAIENYLPIDRKEILLRSSLKKLTSIDLNNLIEEVSRIEGRKIEESDLFPVLFRWFNATQVEYALGADKTGLPFREKEGDIKSFVSVGRYKFYHPVKVLAEYINFEENRGKLNSKRVIRNSIQAMEKNNAEKFGELLTFIKAETGITAQTEDSAFEICKDWFNVQTFAEYLGVDIVSVYNLIKDFGLRTFTVESEKGKSIMLISPKGVDIVNDKVRLFLDDIEKWHKETFGQAINLKNPDDLREWIKRAELAEEFPFISETTAEKMPGLRTYKARLKYIIAREHYVPPIEVERLKQKVISWLQNEDVFKMIKKYRLIPEDAAPDELDYETAEDIIMRIDNEWLNKTEICEKTGITLVTLDRCIDKKKIDFVHLEMFTEQGKYYLPPESAELFIIKDRAALEEGKWFLEEVCGVNVPSFDNVKELLKAHCITAGQIAQVLGLPRTERVLYQRHNTVVFQFTGDMTPNVYWKKEDAEAFLKEEHKKFEDIIKQISYFTDVSDIKTIAELMNFINTKWKSIETLSKELDVKPQLIKKAVRDGRIFSVKVDFTGYRREYYLPPDTKIISSVQNIIDFESNMDRLENIFGGFFTQALLNMPIKLLSGRLGYLQGFLSKCINAGTSQLTGRWKPKTKEEIEESRKWKEHLKRFISNYIAKKLYVEHKGDTTGLIRNLSDFILETDKIIFKRGTDRKEVEEYFAFKEILEMVTKTWQEIGQTKYSLQDSHKPRYYQLFSIRRILKDKKVLLADDTRLGKSYEALIGSVLCAAKKTLIVCTNDAMGMWADEIKKHVGQNTNYKIIDAGLNEPIPSQLNDARSPEVRYVIMNYNTCRDYVESIKALNADYTILDEAHHIGKVSGRHVLRDAIFQLQSGYKVLLSATPLRNRHPEEVWPLLHWIYPEEIGSFTQFRKEFGRKTINFVKLKVFLWNHMVRFTMDEAEKEGARLEMITRIIPMTGLQKEEYKKVMEDFADWYKKHFKKSEITEPLEPGSGEVSISKLFRLRESAVLTRLEDNPDVVLQSVSDPSQIIQIRPLHTGKQIQINSRLFNVGKTENKEYFLSTDQEKIMLSEENLILIDGIAYKVYINKYGCFSNKIEEVVRTIVPPLKIEQFSITKQNLIDLMNPEQKIVIFTESIEVLNAIRKLDRRIKYIYEKVPREKRDEYRKEFNEGKGPQILVSTRRTGGESIPLHGATMIIEMDLPYTVRERTQALARVLGSEQKLKKVPAVYISSEDTIDSDLTKFLETKQSIIDAFIDEEDIDMLEVIENVMNRFRLLKVRGETEERDEIEEKKKELSRRDEDWEKVARVTGIEKIRFIQDPYGKSHKWLTREQEKELMRLYKEENSGAALDTLIKFNIRLVFKIVNHFMAKNKTLADEKEDMASEGFKGLIHAIDKFDVTKNFRLITHATWGIRGRIWEYLADNKRTVRLPAHIKGQFSKLYKIESLYLQKYGCPAKDYADLVKVDPDFELSEEQYNNLVRIRKEGFVSLDAPIGEEGDGGRLIHEVIPGEGVEEVEAGIKRNELMNLLDKAIINLCQRRLFRERKNLNRDIKITCLRIGYDFDKRQIIDRMTLEDIGKIFDMVGERVREIVEEEYLPPLIEELEKLGIRADYFVDSSGGFKDLGPPLEVLLNPLQKIELGNLEYAYSIPAKDYFVDINTSGRGKRRIKITAKIFYAGDKLPNGINAWLVGKDDGINIIAVPGEPGDKIEFLNEILYHEDREGYWFYDVKLDRRSAHILAAYEQALAFAENDNLLPYHESQLNDMTLSQIEYLINEYGKGKRKRLHYELLEEYKDTLEQLYGQNAIGRIMNYERLLIDRARKLRNEIKSDISAFNLDKIITALRGMRDREDAGLRYLTKFKVLKEIKLSIPDYVKSTDELKWWLENTKNIHIKTLCGKLLLAMQGDLKISKPDSVVTTTQQGRYILMMDTWLLDLIKNMPELNSFVEIGISLEPTEHLSLVSEIIKHNPNLISLGLDILPIEKIRYLAVAYFDMSHWKFYLDTSGNILFVAGPDNKCVDLNDEGIKGYIAYVEPIAKSKIGLLPEGEDRGDTFKLGVKKIDVSRFTEEILKFGSDKVFLRQGSFETLNKLKDIDLIFTANTLRNYLNTFSTEFIRTVFQNISGALREGGVFIEANNDRNGYMNFSAISRKKNGNLIPEELIIDFFGLHYAGSGNIRLTLSTLFIYNMIPASLGDAMFEISDAIMNFCTKFREPQVGLHEYWYGTFITNFAGILREKGFNVSIDDKKIIHVKFDGKKSPGTGFGEGSDGGNSAVATAGTYKPEQGQKFQSIPKCLRNSCGDKMEILRNGFNISKSLSLVTIIFDLAVIAVSKTMLSSASLQILIFILGLTTIILGLISLKNSFINLVGIPNLGRERTSANSKSICLDVSISKESFKKALYIFSLAVLPINTLTNTFVSITALTLAMMFLAGFFTDAVYFIISNAALISMFSHPVDYTMHFGFPQILFKILKNPNPSLWVQRIYKLLYGIDINTNCIAHNLHLLAGFYKHFISHFYIFNNHTLTSIKNQGGINSAIATAGMYTPEQHDKMNEKAERDIADERYVKLQTSNFKSQNTTHALAWVPRTPNPKIEYGRAMEAPLGIEQRAQEIMNSLDSETRQALKNVSIYLLPPENPEYPYYLRTEIASLPSIARNDSFLEYQVAHAGSWEGRAKNIFMTTQAFMELPVDIVARILQREARLAKERYEARKAGDLARLDSIGGYDDEVKGILSEINRYIDKDERYEENKIFQGFLEKVEMECVDTYGNSLSSISKPDTLSLMRKILIEHPEFNVIVDKRPDDNYLLNIPFIGHDMAVKKVMNPDSKPLVGIYGGAGADISNFLLSTNASVGYFVDLGYGSDGLYTSYETMKDYRYFKYLNGFACEAYIMGNYFNVLLEELTAIGVSKEDMERIELMRDEYLRNDGNITIEFMWAYPGQEPKKRTIYLVKANIVETSAYPKILKDALSKGVDFYYQKGVSNAMSKYENFVEKITLGIRSGGFIIVDIVGKNGEKIDPLQYIKDVKMERINQTTEKKYWSDFIGPAKGYGWDLGIYRKVDKVSPTGQLDGYTILRFTPTYDIVGGLEKQLQEWNRCLLERNNVTILQMYITDKESNLGVTEERIGRGRLIEIPIKIARVSNGNMGAGIESRIYNIIKRLLIIIGIRDFLRDWLAITGLAPYLAKAPLLKEFYRRTSGGLNADGLDGLIGKANELFEKYDIDLAMIHTAYGGGILIAEIAKSKNVPVLIQNHGENGSFNTIVYRKLLSYADGIAGLTDIAVPEWLRSKYVNLSDGIDTELFNPNMAKPIDLKSTNPVIMLPARVVLDKGHLDLIKTAKYLRGKKGINITIFFAGEENSPEFTEEIKKLVVKYNLQDNVHFVGALSTEELRDYYARSDIVCLPTKSEGLGRVLLEAQAMEKPVIAYNVGGVSEAMEDGKTGYLVKKGDIRGFAEKLYELLEDKGKRESMGKEGRRFVVEKFNLEALAERHEEFYRRVCEQFERGNELISQGLTHKFRKDLMEALEKALEDKGFKKARVTQILNRGLAWIDGENISFESDDVFKIAADVLNKVLRKKNSEKVTYKQVKAVVEYHETAHIALKKERNAVNRINKDLKGETREKLFKYFSKQYGEYDSVEILIKELIASYYTERLLINSLELLDDDDNLITIDKIDPKIAETIEKHAGEFIDRIDIKKLRFGGILEKLISVRMGKKGCLRAKVVKPMQVNKVSNALKELFSSENMEEIMRYIRDGGITLDELRMLLNGFSDEYISEKEIIGFLNKFYIKDKKEIKKLRIKDNLARKLREGVIEYNYRVIPVDRIKRLTGRKMGFKGLLRDYPFLAMQNVVSLTWEDFCGRGVGIREEVLKRNFSSPYEPLAAAFPELDLGDAYFRGEQNIWERTPVSAHKKFMERILTELEKIRQAIISGDEENETIEQLNRIKKGKELIMRLSKLKGKVKILDLGEEVFSLQIGSICEFLLERFYRLYNKIKSKESPKVNFYEFLIMKLGLKEREGEEEKSRPKLMCGPSIFTEEERGILKDDINFMRDKKKKAEKIKGNAKWELKKLGKTKSLRKAITRLIKSYGKKYSAINKIYESAAERAANPLVKKKMEILEGIKKLNVFAEKIKEYRDIVGNILKGFEDIKKKLNLDRKDVRVGDIWNIKLEGAEKLWIIGDIDLNRMAVTFYRKEADEKESASDVLIDNLANVLIEKIYPKEEQVMPRRQEGVSAEGTAKHGREVGGGKTYLSGGKDASKMPIREKKQLIYETIMDIIEENKGILNQSIEELIELVKSKLPWAEKRMIKEQIKLFKDEAETGGEIAGISEIGGLKISDWIMFTSEDMKEIGKGVIVDIDYKEGVVTAYFPDLQPSQRMKKFIASRAFIKGIEKIKKPVLPEETENEIKEVFDYVKLIKESSGILLNYVSQAETYRDDAMAELGKYGETRDLDVLTGIEEYIEERLSLMKNTLSEIREMTYVHDLDKYITAVKGYKDEVLELLRKVVSHRGKVQSKPGIVVPVKREPAAEGCIVVGGRTMWIDNLSIHLPYLLNCLNDPFSQKAKEAERALRFIKKRSCIYEYYKTIKVAIERRKTNFGRIRILLRVVESISIPHKDINKTTHKNVCKILSYVIKKCPDIFLRMYAKRIYADLKEEEGEGEVDFGELIRDKQKGRGRRGGTAVGKGKTSNMIMPIALSPALCGMSGFISILAWQNNPFLIYVKEIGEYLRLRFESLCDKVFSDLPSYAKTALVWTVLIFIYLIAAYLAPVSDSYMVGIGIGLFPVLGLAINIPKGLKKTLDKGIRYLKEKMGGGNNFRDRIIWTGRKAIGLGKEPGWQIISDEKRYVLVSAGNKVFDQIEWSWRFEEYSNLSFMAIKDAVTNVLIKDNGKTISMYLENILKRKVDLNKEIEWIWIDKFQEGSEAGVFRIEIKLTNGKNVKFGIISAKNPGLGSKVVNNDRRNLKWVRSLYTGFNQEHNNILPYEVPEVYSGGRADCVVNGNKYSIYMFLVEWLDNVYEVHPLLNERGELIFKGLYRAEIEKVWDLKISQNIREKSVIIAATIFELTGGKIPRIVYSGGDIVANIDKEEEVCPIYLITIPYFVNDRDPHIASITGGREVIIGTNALRAEYKLSDTIEDRYFLFLMRMLNIETLMFRINKGGDITKKTFPFRMFPEPDLVFSGMTKALIRMYGEEEGVKMAFSILKRFLKERTEFKEKACDYLERLKREYRFIDKAEEEVNERELREYLEGIATGSFIVVHLLRLMEKYNLPESKIVEILEELGFRHVPGKEDKWKLQEIKGAEGMREDLGGGVSCLDVCA